MCISKNNALPKFNFTNKNLYGEWHHICNCCRFVYIYSKNILSRNFIFNSVFLLFIDLKIRQEKWSFPLRISSVKVTVKLRIWSHHIYWGNPYWKASFFVQWVFNSSVINPFHANVPFLYPLKMSKNQTFSDVFWGYRIETLE